MGNVVNREIHVKRAPSGMSTEDDFEIVEVSIPEPGAGGAVGSLVFQIAKI